MALETESKQVEQMEEVLTGMGIPTPPPAEPAPGEGEPPKPPEGEPPKPTEGEPPAPPTPPPAEPPKPSEEPPKPPEEPPAPVPPADTRTPEQVELDTLRGQVKELRDSLTAVAKGYVTPAAVKAVAPAPGEGGAPAPVRKGPVIIPFFKEEKEIDEAFKNVENTNLTLSKVVHIAVESIARHIPEVISRVSDQQVGTRMAINEFYNNNEDLKGYKEFCGFLSNKIAAEKPDITFGDLLTEVAVEARKVLKLMPAGDGVPPGGDANRGGAGAPPPSAPGAGPALPPAGGGGRKSGHPSLAGIEKEFDDMLKST